MSLQPSLDEQLHGLRRAALTEPDNPVAQNAYHGSLRRFFEPQIQTLINSLEAWQSADETSQDAALAYIAADMSRRFQFLGSLRGPERPEGPRLRIGQFLHKKSQLVFHLIPGGSFTMGTPGIMLEEPDHDSVRSEILRGYTLWEHFVPDTEGPAQSVHMAPFLMARTTVLQKHWTRYFQKPVGGTAHPNHPIDELSWFQAHQWLRIAGSGMRLPSEAEWEYACRAGTAASQLFFWGQDFDPSYCWCKSNSQFRTHDPEEHRDKANAFGLIDMLGNVCEWCEDDWYEDHDERPSTGQARLRSKQRSQNAKVKRGGSWRSDSGECRSANRYFLRRRYQNQGAGFRPVFSVKIPKAAEE